MNKSFLMFVGLGLIVATGSYGSNARVARSEHSFAPEAIFCFNPRLVTGDLFFPSVAGYTKGPVRMNYIDGDKSMLYCETGSQDFYLMADKGGWRVLGKDSESFSWSLPLVQRKQKEGEYVLSLPAGTVGKKMQKGQVLVDPRLPVDPVGLFCSENVASYVEHNLHSFLLQDAYAFLELQDYYNWADRALTLFVQWREKNDVTLQGDPAVVEGQRSCAFQYMKSTPKGCAIDRLVASCHEPRRMRSDKHVIESSVVRTAPPSPPKRIKNPRDTGSVAGALSPSAVSQMAPRLSDDFAPALEEDYSDVKPGEAGFSSRHVPVVSPDHAGRCGDGSQ